MPQVVDGVTNIPLPGRPFRFDPASSGTAETGGTLREFLLGPENHLVAAAVRSVLDPQGDFYSPVVFYGPTGTGKSHLALGLVAAWKASFRKQAAIYATAPDFLRELADAIQTKTTDEFAAQYRQAALLVLEDLQHLAGKHAAQRELICTLDALSAAGARVVLTANTSPPQLRGITPGLQSRLVAGLEVRLASPNREVRLEILQRFAQLRGVRLADGTACTLADGLAVNVPELFQAVIQLGISSGASGVLVTPDAARAYIAERNGSRRPSLRAIASLTARQFSLTMADLRSPSRRHAVVAARGVAMYLARNLTAHSLNAIGRYFGCRDHTTVSYGCRRTAERLETEPQIQHALADLHEKLEAARSTSAFAPIWGKRVGRLSLRPCGATPQSTAIGLTTATGAPHTAARRKPNQK